MMICSLLAFAPLLVATWFSAIGLLIQPLVPRLVCPTSCFEDDLDNALDFLRCNYIYTKNEIRVRVLTNESSLMWEGYAK